MKAVNNLNFAGKVLAVVLAIAIVFTMIPAPGLRASAASTNSIILKIRDRDSNSALVNAEVSYTVNGDAATVYPAASDSSGNAALTSATNLLSNSETGNINLSYTVKQNGYLILSGNDVFSSAETADNSRTVYLTALSAPTLKYTGTDSEFTVTITPAVPEGYTVSKVYVQKNTEAAAEVTSDGSGYTCTIPRAEAVSSANKYYFYYVLNDGSVSKTAKLDITKPTITRTGNSSSTWQKEITITGTVQKGAFSDGISAVYLSTSNNTSNTGAILQTVTESQISENGIYSFTISNTDFSGNYYIYCKDKEYNFSDVITMPVYLDCKAPAIDTANSNVLNTVNASGWTKDYLTVKITAADTDTGYQSGINAFYYKTDDADYKTVSTSYWTNNNDGTYTIKLSNISEYQGSISFYCEDKAGNRSNEFTVNDLKIDTIAPTITDFSFTTSNWTNEGITITGTAADAFSDIKRVYYTKSGNAGENDITGELSVGGTFTINIPAQNFKGTYTVYCVDNADNVYSRTASVQMDIQKGRVITAVASPAGEWTNGSVTITGEVKDDTETASDAVSGIKTVHYYKTAEGRSTAKYVNVSSSGSYTITLPADDYKGTYSLYCTDYAGNISELPDISTAEIWQDKTKPEIESVSVAYNGTAAGTFTVTVKAEDLRGTSATDDSAVSGISALRYSASSNMSNYTQLEVDDVVYNDAEKTYTFTIDAESYKTTYGSSVTNIYYSKLYVCTVDKAGNVSDTANSDLKLDTTAPEITSAAPSTSGWTGAYLTIKASFSDPASSSATTDALISGVKSVYCVRSDGVGETYKFDVPADNDGTYTFTIPAQTYEGNYYVYCDDYAGNESDNYEVYVKMDTTRPVIEYTAEPSDWTNTQVIISGKVTDAHSGVKSLKYIRGSGLSGGEFENCILDSEGNFSITVPAENFNGQYLLLATDKVENDKNEYVNVYIDVTTPKVVSAEADETDWTNENIAISGEVSDNLSGVKTVYLYKGTDLENYVDSVTLSDEQTEYSFTVSAQDYNGNYTVYCVDKAGNKSAAADSKTVSVKMDVTEPEISECEVDNSDWTNRGVTITGKAGDITPAGMTSSVVSGLYKVYIRQCVEGAPEEEVSFTSNGSFTYNIAPQNFNGRYEIYAEDNAGNYSESKFVSVLMDTERCIVNTAEASSEDWTNGAVIINGKVSDVQAEGADISSVSGVDKVYYKQGEDGTETEITTFSKENGEYSFAINKQDYEGDFIIYCKDTAGNISLETTISVKMDKTAPAVDSASASPDTWTNGEVTISGKVSDALSGVKQVYCAKDGDTKMDVFVITDENPDGSFSFTIPAQQYEGDYQIYCVDYAGNTSEIKTVGVKMDNGTPDRTVTYSDAVILDNETGAQLEDFSEGDDVTLYYSDEAVITFTLKEKFFNSAACTVKVNGTAVNNVTWDEPDENGEITGTLTLSENGDYTVTFDYTDNAGNAMEQYASPKISVDDTAPVINVEFSSDKAPVNEKYYSCDRTATITVTEHNFIAALVTAQVSAVDINGNRITITDNFAEYLKNDDNWTHSGDTHTAKIVFKDDANYSFSLNMADIAGNAADSYTSDGFTVDKTKPAANDISITYSTPLNTAQQIISALTFGYYKNDVTITVTARDNISGIDGFKLSYTKQEGASSINVDKFMTSLSVEQSSTDKGIYTATYKLTASQAEQYRGYISVTATDMAGLVSDEKSDSGRINVVDNIAPELGEVVYAEPDAIIDADKNKQDTFEQDDEDVTIYYSDYALVSFRIKEANFYPEDVKIALVKDGVNGIITPEVEWANNGDIYTGSFAIRESGDYSFTVSYTDRSTNEMTSYSSPKIAVDSDKPVISVEYDPVIDADAEDVFTSQTQKVTITVIEHNFDAADVEMEECVRDLLLNEIETDDYSSYIKNNDKWQHDGDKHTFVFKLTGDAYYDFAIDYKDVCGNESDGYASPTICVDTSAPDTADITISYSSPIDPIAAFINNVTFGFYSYDNPVTVKVTAKDNDSGISCINWEYNRKDGASDINLENLSGSLPAGECDENGVYTASFTLPAEYADSLLGNISVTAENKTGLESNIKTDSGNVIVVDSISPTLSASYGDVMIVDNTTGERLNSFENGDDVTLYAKQSTNVVLTVTEANFFASDMTVKLNGKKQTNLLWIDLGNDRYSAKITLGTNGEYVISAEYTDRSRNEMEEYTSPKIVYDENMAYCTFEFTDEKEPANQKYYTKPRTALITVVEQNFRAEDVNLNIAATDILGNPITLSTDYAAYLADDENWTHDGDTHTAEITISEDGNYTFGVTYNDFISDSSVGQTPAEFTIDSTAPKAGDITVEFSKELNFAEEILNAVTFGYYYYHKETTVTVTASDNISGIDYIEWSYIRENGASDINYKEVFGRTNKAEKGADGRYTASFTITAYPSGQYRGSIAVQAVNMAGLESSPVSDENKIIVVDNISPEYEVTLGTPDKIVDNTTGNIVDNYSEDSDVTLYYSDKATAVFTINEANFYPDDVVIKVSGESTDLTVWKKLNADVWTGTLELSNHGIYTIDMSYTDRSGNSAESYTSPSIKVGTPAPAVEVILPHNDGRYEDYYSEDCTVQLKITTDNFKAENIDVQLSAKTLSGADVPCDAADYIKDKDNWTRTGSVYNCFVTLNGDAVYRLSLKYTDDYTDKYDEADTGYFTVDTTAPSADSIKIEYNSELNFFEQIINGITFGEYYANSEVSVKVTVTAFDDVSPVDTIELSYDVSRTDKARAGAEPRSETKQAVVDNDGNYYAVFSLPRAEFNGYITELYASATNMAGLTSEKKAGSISVCMDNTTPENLSISYSDSVADDTVDGDKYSYYNKPVTVTLSASDALSGISHLIYSFAADNGDSIPDTVIDGDNITFNGSTAIAAFTLPVVNASGIVTLTAVDKAGNSAKISSDIHIVVDDTAPEITVTYTKPDGEKDGVPQFDGPVNGTIVIKENNFDKNDVKVTLHKDGGSVEITPEWTDGEGNTHIGRFTISESGDYTVSVTYTDKSGNVMPAYTSEPMRVEISDTPDTSSDDSSGTSSGDSSNTSSGDNSNTSSGDNSNTSSGDNSNTSSGDNSGTPSGDNSGTPSGDNSGTPSGDSGNTTDPDTSDSSDVDPGNSNMPTGVQLAVLPAILAASAFAAAGINIFRRRKDK